MISYEVGYKTGSGNTMTMFVHAILYDRNAVYLIDDPKYLCDAGTGCKGHNGGCPPYAPKFSMLKKSNDKLYVLAVEFDMAWAIKYSGWWKGVSAPGLYILVYADRLTMSYTQRLLKHFENAGYYTLGVSNCPGCRPTDCTVVRGELCCKPEKRRFSVEATGVDCGALHQRMFGEVLPWWFRTPEHMPCKMVRYAVVFTDKPAQIMGNHLFEAMSGDKSYWDETPASAYGSYHSYHIDRLEVPTGCHDEGLTYSAYRIPVEEMIK